MAPLKWRKKKFRHFWNVYYPKTHLIKALNSLDSSRPNGRLSQNPETRGSRELFLPENDFKTCSAVNFPKNIQILEAPGQRHEKTNWRHEIQTLSSNYVLRAKLKKNQLKKAKKLNSTIFWAWYSWKFVLDKTKFNISKTFSIW